jgi:ABC-type spermidine/putrescine transport system permease subunit II
MTPLSWPMRLVCWLVLACLAAPSLVVIPMAFSDSVYMDFPSSGLSLQWFQQFFTDPQWQRATWRSLRIALAVTFVATSMATMAVLSLAKLKGPARRVAFSLIISPMIIPVIAYSIAIYGIYSKLGLIGTDIGLIVAHTVLAIPFPFLTIAASYANYDRTLSKAAASSGAPPYKSFFLITLPMIRPGIVAGALFAFLTSFDEVIVAIFIGGVQSTLPKMMFDSIRFELSPVLAAIATLLILITSLFLLIGRVGAVDTYERA